MSTIFEHITLIGCGLIGSSIARSLKRRNDLVKEFTICDRNLKHLQAAQSHDLAHHYSANAAEACIGAELIIFAIPVGGYRELAKIIAPHLSPDTIISDVGSTKISVFEHIGDLIPQDCHLIPAHPVAGTEHSGPDAGLEDLFDHHYVILTPDEDGPHKLHQDEKLILLTKFWEGLGADVEVMHALHHDRILAMTSHLPHLIAYTVVNTADNLQKRLLEENATSKIKAAPNDITRFSAGGFRDFTRIAASNPIMWRDIFLNNSEAVLELATSFRDDLDKLCVAIAEKDSEQLEEWFSATQSVRDGIIAEGQTRGLVEYKKTLKKKSLQKMRNKRIS